MSRAKREKRHEVRDKSAEREKRRGGKNNVFSFSPILELALAFGNVCMPLVLALALVPVVKSRL